MKQCKQCSKQVADDEAIGCISVEKNEIIYYICKHCIDEIEQKGIEKMKSYIELKRANQQTFSRLLAKTR